jgi:hypothetical protein
MAAKKTPHAPRNPEVAGYSSERPAGHDPPGSSQPVDAITPPADVQREEELLEEAIEAGAVVPAQPPGLPVERRASTETEAPVLGTPDADDDRGDHAGIEDEDSNIERRHGRS